MVWECFSFSLIDLETFFRVKFLQIAKFWINRWHWCENLRTHWRNFNHCFYIHMSFSITILLLVLRRVIIFCAKILYDEVINDFYRCNVSIVSNSDWFCIMIKKQLVNSSIKDGWLNKYSLKFMVEQNGNESYRQKLSLCRYLDNYYSRGNN